MSKFGDAFKAARNAGLETFDWNGRTFNTKLSLGKNPDGSTKVESDDAWRAALTKNRGTAEIVTGGGGGSEQPASNAQILTNARMQQAQATAPITVDPTLQTVITTPRLPVVNYDNMLFGKAFNAARATGASTFNWRGTTYSTQTDKNWRQKWRLDKLVDEIENNETETQTPNDELSEINQTNTTSVIPEYLTRRGLAAIRAPYSFFTPIDRLTGDVAGYSFIPNESLKFNNEYNYQRGIRFYGGAPHVFTDENGRVRTAW